MGTTEDWIYIDNIDSIPNDAFNIHCDTRDFHIKIVTDKPSKSNDIIKKRHLIHKDEILPKLKEIETMSGGKAYWRLLNFSTIRTRLGWLKYIRFQKYEDDMYGVYTTCGDLEEPINISLCKEEYLEKIHLGTMDDKFRWKKFTDV